ncbi:MAG TPA: tRNA (adenosine(37)-N6)-dimethylallyltransferase MiaA [Thermodesulfovibrionales bacterium]|nr:tRNA (adenosine(37)-N6)-dimethylallyltransferase MiaA [Thermodesulfovibrionales bacterium]
MKKVIILLGPTGVGKTEASILLAQSLNTEIISADSMQLYRHMDIGTAKPTHQEMSLVKHHMIDIVEPSESFSAGQYIEQVIPIIEGLHGRGKTPVVVGGTGLYIKAMTRGLFRGPSADWHLREELLSREEEKKGSLYASLIRLDPSAALRITKNDTRRIVRALEVRLKAGMGITQLQESRTTPLPYDFLRIGIIRERKELYRLIEERVNAMLAAGLVDEVRNVLLRNPGKTALQAIGYKEIAAHFRDEYPLDEAVRLIVKRSRNYAKRQITWFNKEEGIQWVDVTAQFSGEDILKAIAILIKNALP